MEISVKYIPTDYHKGTDGTVTASGNKPALCFITDDEARCVINTEEGVDLVSLPVLDIRKSPPVSGYEDDDEAARKFLQYYNVTLKKKKAIGDGVQELMDLIGTEPTEFPKKKTSKPPAKSKAPKKSAKPKKKAEPSAPSIVNKIAEETQTTPSRVRKALRAAGLAAPYTDEKAMREALRINGAKK